MGNYQQLGQNKVSEQIEQNLDDDKPLPVPPDDAEPVPIETSGNPKEQAPMIVEEEGEERT